jgi:transposase
MEPRKPYPTDVSDREWELLQPYVPEPKRGGRPEKYPKRDILNGIFYIVRGGCAWRLLPHDFPPWQIVYHYFWLWRQDGTWQRMHDLLRGDVRGAAGKHRQPSAGVIDSQSIKTTEKGGSVGLMRLRTSMAASGTSSSIREGCSWPWWSRLRVYKIALGPCHSWLFYGTSVPECA